MRGLTEVCELHDIYVANTIIGRCGAVNIKIPRGKEAAIRRQGRRFETIESIVGMGGGLAGVVRCSAVLVGVDAPEL